MLCFLLATFLEQMRIHCLSCATPLTELPYASGTYCAKCDTTCLTCSGSSINSCSSCRADFTLNSGTSTCVAPNTALITTVVSAYHSYGFEMETSWWSGGAAWSSCGTITVIRATGQTIITATHLNLNYHYQKRMLVSLWWFGGTSETLNIVMKTTGGGAQESLFPGGSQLAGPIPGAAYDPYCSSRTNNYDLIWTAVARDIVFEFFSNSSSANWGLR